MSETPIIEMPVATLPGETVEDREQAANAVPADNPSSAKARAKALLESGSTYIEASAKLGIRAATLRTWVYRYGWKMPAAAARALAEAKPISQAPQAPQPAPATNPDKLTARLRKALQAPPRDTAQSIIEDRSARTRDALSKSILLQAELLSSIPVTSLAQMRNSRFGQGVTALTSALISAASDLFDWDSQRSPGVVVINEIEKLEVTAPSSAGGAIKPASVTEPASVPVLQSAGVIDIQAERVTEPTPEPVPA